MVTDNRYPVEILDEYEDDGTMPASLHALADSVVGHRIVKAERGPESRDKWSYLHVEPDLVLTLDDGRQVHVSGSADCCAYTEIKAFLLHPEAVDHVIMGVGTTGDYTHWHIYADYGDILELSVNWSCGNPFYYGYGFTIEVHEAR